jgi:signal peptidase II
MRDAMAMARWLLLSVLVVALDQLTKYLAETGLEFGEPLPVIPFLNLTLAYNTGAAFSFLSEAGGWQRWAFAGVAVGVSALLALWLLHLPRGSRWMPSALTLVIGGALGNLWDRLAYGHVVDFIDVYYARWHWPAFNLADSAITVGAIMLVIDAFFMTRHPTQADVDEQD